MKIMKYTLWATVGLSLLFASFESILDINPKDRLTTKDYFTNEEQLRLYSNQFYSNNFPGDGDIYKDNADVLIVSPLDDEVSGQRVIPETGGGWSWSALRSINFLLDNLGNCKDQKVRDKYEALARFFRAYFYFEKVKRFGDVSWYDKVLGSDDADLYKASDSREFVMGKIMEDLNFAIEVFKETNRTKELYRVTWWTAQALKSRVGLFEGTYRKYHGLGDYEDLFRESADAAWKIIDSGKYNIWSNEKPKTDYYNLFIQEDLSSNSECIMPRVYEAKLLMHNNTRQLEESYTGMSRAMFEQYLCADGLPTAVSPTYGSEASMLANELAKRDPRLAQSIDNPNLPYKLLSDGTPSFNALPSLDTKYCTTGYHVMKYHSPDPEQWNIGLSTLDVFIFRYAEVLLNYAEAKAELGECDQEVLNITINELRDRVEMPHLTKDVGFEDPNWPDYGYELAPLLYEIRRERAVELLGEGFRWDDIVRWKAGKLLENPKTMLGMKVSSQMQEAYGDFSRSLNEEGYMIVYPDKQSRKWDDKLYLHPLPIDQTTMNPNLLPNNPGWE